MKEQKTAHDGGRRLRRGVRLPCPLHRRRRRLQMTLATPRSPYHPWSWSLNLCLLPTTGAGEEELEEEEPRREAAVEVVKGRRTRCARAGSTAAATRAHVGGPGCVRWRAGRRARVDRVSGAGHVRRELSIWYYGQWCSSGGGYLVACWQLTVIIAKRIKGGCFVKSIYAVILLFRWQYNHLPNKLLCRISIIPIHMSSSHEEKETWCYTGG